MKKYYEQAHCNEKFRCIKTKRKKTSTRKKIHIAEARNFFFLPEKKQRECLYFISGFKLNALLFFFWIFASTSACLPYILKIQRNKGKRNKCQKLSIYEVRVLFSLSHVTISSQNFHFVCSFSMLRQPSTPKKHLYILRDPTNHSTFVQWNKNSFPFHSRFIDIRIRFLWHVIFWHIISLAVQILDCTKCLHSFCKSECIF